MFELGIENCSVAPIYRRIPFKVRLSNEKSFFEFSTEIDIRRWMPGKYTEKIILELLKNIAVGEYNVEIGISSNSISGIYFCTDAKRNVYFYKEGENLMKKPILVPIPKKIQWMDGSFHFADATVRLYFDSAFADSFENEIRQLKEFTRKCINLSRKSEANIVFVKNTEFEEEEHKIEVTEHKIVITASQPVGVFRALTTLKQIYNQCGEFLCLVIQDKPDIKSRQAQFDCRTRKPKLQELKDYVQLLVDMKYNEYILYFESFSFYYANFPQFYHGERVIMPEEIKDLDVFCRERYVKLIPFQASFGHMYNWLEQEELRELGIPEEGGGGSLNPLDPRSLALVEKIYDCFLPCFSSDYVIIGFDEVQELGTGKTKKVADEIGVENLFVDFLFKVKDLAFIKYNKKVMYEADMLYKYPHIWKKVPEDAMTLIWGYNAYDTYYDRYTADVDAHNRDFIICCSTSNFASFTGMTENALYNIKNAAYIINKFDHAKGIQVTDWGDIGNPQFQPISYFGFVIGACYGWNSNYSIAREYSELYSKWGNIMHDNWVNEFVDHSIQYTAIDYLNNVVFKCKNAKLGDLLYRMGNYKYIEGENIGGSTRCFQLYMSGFNPDKINIPRALMKRVEPQYYESVVKYMQDIYHELEQAVGENEETKLAIEEMKCNVKMVILMEKALIIQYYYLNHAVDDSLVQEAHAVADEIYKMKEEFRALWLVRNWPKGHEEAYRNFNEIADALKAL